MRGRLMKWHPAFSYASGLGVVGQQMDLIKDSPHMSMERMEAQRPLHTFHPRRSTGKFQNNFFAPNMRMAASCCCDKKRGLQHCSGAKPFFLSG